MRTVVCADCEATRVGRLVDGETKPYRQRCGNCGSTAYRDALE